MTFYMWWTEEVGHPPANEQERFAFEGARKAWTAWERELVACPQCHCFHAAQPPGT